jgi:hypothetical protein
MPSSILRLAAVAACLLAAAPASAQASGARVTVAATVVAPLDTRPPAPGALTSEAPSGRRAEGADPPRVTVTLPDGVVCSATPDAGGPAWLTCRTARERPRAVVFVAA